MSVPPPFTTNSFIRDRLFVVAVRDKIVGIARAGDVRAYRFRVDELARLTNDHSELAELVANEVGGPDNVTALLVRVDSV